MIHKHRERTAKPAGELTDRAHNLADAEATTPDWIDKRETQSEFAYQRDKGARDLDQVPRRSPRPPVRKPKPKPAALTPEEHKAAVAKFLSDLEKVPA